MIGGVLAMIVLAVAMTALTACGGSSAPATTASDPVALLSQAGAAAGHVNSVYADLPGTDRYASGYASSIWTSETVNASTFASQDNYASCVRWLKIMGMPSGPGWVDTGIVLVPDKLAVIEIQRGPGDTGPSAEIAARVHGTVLAPVTQ